MKWFLNFFVILFLIVLIGLLIGCSPRNLPAPPENDTDPVNDSAPSDNSDPIEVDQVWEVSYSPNEAFNGLTIDIGGDVDWESVAAGDPPERAFRSGNGLALDAEDGNTVEDYYISFGVDDSVLYRGNPTKRVVIEVAYLDEGTDTFNVQYDSFEDPFTDTSGVVKTDTGEILTAAFSLCNAQFGNRTNGADFRISDSGDGADTFTSVSVRLQPAPEGVASINVDSCGANPFDDQPDSDAIQACLDQMCSGDSAVFTSPEGNPKYQGYMIDKTIFLMLTGAKSDLTFTSNDENDHALLKATSNLLGFVVQLYSKSWIHNSGLIDDIKFWHLDIDSNRDERICFGPDGKEGGGDDNYGSWQPECLNNPEEPWNTDPWCSAGGLGMNGGFNPYDLYLDYESNPQYWSTGLEVRDVIISNVECGTGFAFSGAAGTIANVTVDTVGDHVHVAGCADTDPDGEWADWSDGMTLIGPAHVIENNTVINPTDIGIVHFGGRNTIIRNNTVIVESGNNGAFGGIALHPWWFGVNGDYVISGNTVVSKGDNTCGGMHAGINIGGQMWGAACSKGSPAAIGNIDSCSGAVVSPGETFCNEGQLCQEWIYVPATTNFTLIDNTVTGAHINYLIGGIQFEGNFEDTGNISNSPQDTDWQGADGCYDWGITNPIWGPLDFAAANPTVPGWTEQEVYCER